MKILTKGIMPNGIPIQIEDWSSDYSFAPYGDTLGSYPKSKVSHPGSFSPKGNETFRCSFKFASFDEVKEAFNALLNGEKSLSDFKEHLYQKEYADCV